MLVRTLKRCAGLINFEPGVQIELDLQKQVIDELLADKAIQIVEPDKKESAKPKAESKGE